MSFEGFEITCPYCFGKMRDDEVLFRSERVSQGECDILPDEYDDLEDFTRGYQGPDKEEILQRYREWEFFAEGEDPLYERFWSNFGGTTETHLADEVLKVKAYRRKVIDPGNEAHHRYLKPQEDGNYFIYDGQNMVAQIELLSGEKCNRRVCKHCHNPLPDNYGRNPVKFAAIVGITGSGKTVYLSQLLRNMGTYAVKVGLSAIVNTDSARTFLKNNPVTAGKALPGSTPKDSFQQPLFYELERDVGYGRVTETFVLYDVAGEVFDERELVNRFAPYLEHADGIVLLIDPMQIQAISGVAEENKALNETTAVLDALRGYHFNDGQQRAEIPVAVCISKADARAVQSVLDDELKAMLRNDVVGIEDRRGFNLPLFNAEAYNPILRKLFDFFRVNDPVLAQRMRGFASYAYFAFTALGCDTEDVVGDNGAKYQCPVGPVIPKRIEEPLLWLFHEFGYIGVNQAIDYPDRDNTECPNCGSREVEELPEDKREIKVRRGLIKKKIYATHRCRECNHYWEKQ